MKVKLDEQSLTVQLWPGVSLGFVVGQIWGYERPVCFTVCLLWCSEIVQYVSSKQVSRKVQLER